jgi:hypothetical protein
VDDVYSIVNEPFAQLAYSVKADDNEAVTIAESADKPIN